MSRGRGRSRREVDFSVGPPDVEVAVTRMLDARAGMNRAVAAQVMKAPTLPNPGYPLPQGIRLILAGGVVVRAKAVFEDVVMDKGVPTPRFQLVLPEDLELNAYSVQRIEAAYWPPGTILMFPQTGNPQENAERIVEQSRRAAFEKLMMTRKDNP